MRHLPCRLDEAAALRALRAQRRGLIKRLFTRPVKAPNPDTPRTPPFFERIWMPYYVVPVQVTSTKGPGEILTSVDGWAGGFAIFQREVNLLEGEVEGDIFHPKLSPGEVVPIARRELLTSIMRRRGQRKPVITGAGEPYLVYFPYWVYYYEPRRGRYAIRLVDAADGQIPGNRLRNAVLEAFLAVDSGKDGENR